MLNHLDVFPRRSNHLLPCSSSAVRLCYVARVLECRRLQAHATGWPIAVTQGAEEHGLTTSFPVIDTPEYLRIVFSTVRLHRLVS
jgi:hypothetical protein